MTVGVSTTKVERRPNSGGKESEATNKELKIIEFTGCFLCGILFFVLLILEKMAFTLKAPEPPDQSTYAVQEHLFYFRPEYRHRESDPIFQPLLNSRP
ncbi:hypothetical protein AVEN_53469-1 [Araneus ventricosus]|uniref:Uncharacterized protein n=1 Tax=Araneus ventricosus TaxID=182803 RepID=A0A4Y2AC13_ARAVE|nr:hypothetical protein AVEN_53469-1 [Araneus ventricosus]